MLHDVHVGAWLLTFKGKLQGGAKRPSAPSL